MNKAVFFDRDGTLIEEKNYLSNVEDIKIFEDAYKALKLLQDNDFKIIIVSNQSGVARGYFTIEEVENINKAIVEKFNDNGIKIDGVYYCPHHESGIVKEYSIKCNCRKPEIAMADKAKADFNLDLAECFMVGDKESDISFGHNFGAKATILVNTGYGKAVLQSKTDLRCDNLYEACCTICKF